MGNKKRRKGFIALSISILTEVFATSMLKMSDGFTVLFPSAAAILGYCISFYSLSICLQTIPLSLAYAVWSGIGTALTAVIGVLVWDDPANILSLTGIILIIFGVILLHSPSTKTEKKMVKEK